MEYNPSQVIQARNPTISPSPEYEEHHNWSPYDNNGGADKTVSASSGFQPDVKALQKFLRSRHLCLLAKDGAILTWKHLYLNWLGNSFTRPHIYTKQNRLLQCASEILSTLKAHNFMQQRSEKSQ